ncbi:MAG: PfkB family carbohydrate kinase [Clostridiales bacterium]|nr:PfkB family carbohydrate kinase [Clostridiales bacterium]MDD7035592.1 PfkB family carbohydrate kinase [Bacillota bacterium]MDY2919823.1 PfkB family carbohydrate kinase [Lentihominibacter sp.]
MKVIGTGDNVVDRYIDRRIMFPGGNAVNFAAYARRCGVESAYLGNIADDPEGHLVKESLEELGVEVSECPYMAGLATERCDVVLNEGDRQFVGSTYGPGTWKPFTIGEEHMDYLAGFDLIHCGCYGEMADEIHKLEGIDAMKTYDFSCEEEYRTDEYLEKVCPYIDLALFSAEEMSEDEMETVMRKAHDLGSGLVLVTMGTRGQLLWDGEIFHRGKVKLIEAVDTMGAGDSFFTAFAISLLRGLEYEAAFEYAADFSAKTCLTEGAFGFGKEY